MDLRSILPAVSLVLALLVAPAPLLTGCASEQGSVATDDGEDSVAPTSLASIGTSQVENTASELPIGLADEGFTLISIEPLEGLITGGTEVTLTGTGLRAGMVVFFGESEAIDLFVVSSNLAVMRTPPHPAGLVDVSAFHPDVEFGAPRDLPGAFKYYAELVVGDVEPSEGSIYGGEPVTVTGSGFGAGTRFFIDGKAALAQSRVDDNTLIGVTPPGSFGPADLQVVHDGTIATRDDAFTYRQAPEISSLAPVAGPPDGGTSVRIRGQGFTANTTVLFGETPVSTDAVAPDGRWLDVTSPAGPGGDVVDVSVANSWGLAVAELAWAWTDPDDDPYVLGCATMFPTSGPAEGGQVVQLSCNGLQYDPTVTFGGKPAEIITLDAATGTLAVETPPGAGSVWVEVSHTFDAITVPVQYSYEEPPSVVVDSITPAQGPVEGGTAITLRGAGFGPGTVVFVGALSAASLEVVSDTELYAITPEGSPGMVDVRVVAGGQQAVLEDGFEFVGDTLTLDLVTPETVARAGGTYMRVYGTGFDETTSVSVGGVTCDVISRLSGAEIHVRSPKLEVGVYDVMVDRGGETRTLTNAVTVYDPRSGYGGTWGEPVDETVNVTVRGTSGYGPIAGAFVMLGEDPATQLKGYTDENGQITFSEPGLLGPVVVTASHPDFYSYSIVVYDAINATVFLGLLNPPPGTPPPSTSWPPATLRGNVYGLGKYVLPPPGSCEALAIDETEHCKACDPNVGCDDEGFACTDVKEQGTFCAQTCLAPTDCPEGYACTPTLQGERCLPAPGEKVAKCILSNQSGYSLEPPVQEGGWVEPYGSYELISGRLGELAVICFGGYRDSTGQFTPTVMGVRRHIFAESDTITEGLDVTLDHPLDRTFRLRMMDPPRWPTGVQPPSVTISLDLGPDGWIPFSRELIDAGNDTWLATRQLSRLTGELYGSKFQFYTQLRADTPTLMPRAYNLVRAVDTVAEDRLPVFVDGQWTLEQAQLDADLNGLWGPSANQIYAVGEGGLILLFSGNAWTAQSSGTDATLLAVAGRAGDDLYAVGERGTVLHHAGAGWQAVDAPMDVYRAAATAPGQPLYVAGAIRVRQWDGTTWSIVGPPTLQDIHGLAALEDGRLAAVGSGGRIFLRDVAGTWNQLPAVTDATLRGVHWNPITEELLAVGDDGTLVRVNGGEPELVEMPTPYDLTAITEGPDGTVYVVGDNGVALRRVVEDGPLVKAGDWVSDTIEDYRSRAHAVFVPSDGGPPRIVGSAAFILGPYVHWGVMTEPLHDSALSAPRIAWTASGGADPSYTRLSIAEETGKLRWRLVVDGAQWAVDLPDVQAASGISPFGSGKRRLEILRVLNENFDIDGYTTREFSISRRDSWSLNQSFFYVP